MTTLRVSELFVSIQGESTYAGQPCGFIRLAGCSQRCAWCDTTYAFGPDEAWALEAILDRVASWGVRLVEVTGGEPLEQAEAQSLLAALCDAGYQVLLETSGAQSIEHVDERVTIIMDIKCPGSGESEHNRWQNLEHLKPWDEVKFVIRDRADFDWAVETMSKRKPAFRDRPVHFSPVHEELDSAELARWILDARLDVRLQLQVHKYLWPTALRGV